MSAPRTNVEKQRRNHRGPLIGMGLGILVVAGLFAIFMSRQVDPIGEEGVLPAVEETTAPAGN